VDDKQHTGRVIVQKTILEKSLKQKEGSKRKKDGIEFNSIRGRGGLQKSIGVKMPRCKKQIKLTTGKTREKKDWVRGNARVSDKTSIKDGP